MAALVGLTAMFAVPAGATGRHFSGLPASTPATPRPLPSPFYGVTVDSIGNLSQIVAGAQHLPDMPTTRLYFDVKEPARYYAAAVDALQPVSFLMGELLDSSDEKRISAPAFSRRVKSYLSTLGDKIDLWEIGNEVNGNWTGRYRVVETKLTDAYDDVSAAGDRTALTLYYNAGCGDGASELDPLAFSAQYVPQNVRDGLDYVLLSYYEDDCNDIRPSPGTWTQYFQQLHALYPNAHLGFGEIGIDQPVAASTQANAESVMRYYYGLKIALPYYVGGYFWWYYGEDGLPYGTAPLWPSLQSAFTAEAGVLTP